MKQHKRNVISATQFYNELDILEIRLETMSPYVDYFIISESTKTHSGLDKPLYFLDNKKRFDKFANKIIHQVIAGTPGNVEQMRRMDRNQSELHQHVVNNVMASDWFDKSIESYFRDTYEKEAVILGTMGCNPEDIFLFGDMDEIVRPEALKWLIENFDPDQIYHFKNDMFYYYFNNQKVNEPWIGTLALSMESAWNKSLCELRTNKRGIFIENGGWHFTSMGSAEIIKRKIESWGEQSLNIPIVKDNLADNVENFLAYGRDLFFRPAQFVIRDLNDGTFPTYIVTNQDKFKNYIWSKDEV